MGALDADLPQIEGIGKAVMKFPGLFGTGINKIDRTIEFLKAAGVVEIAKCISRHPQVYWTMSSNLELSIFHGLMQLLVCKILFTGQFFLRQQNTVQVDQL